MEPFKIVLSWGGLFHLRLEWLPNVERAFKSLCKLNNLSLLRGKRPIYLVVSVLKHHLNRCSQYHCPDHPWRAFGTGSVKKDGEVTGHSRRRKTKVRPSVWSSECLMALSKKGNSRHLEGCHCGNTETPVIQIVYPSLILAEIYFWNWSVLKVFQEEGHSSCILASRRISRVNVVQPSSSGWFYLQPSTQAQKVSVVPGGVKHTMSGSFDINRWYVMFVRLTVARRTKLFSHPTSVSKQSLPDDAFLWRGWWFY